MVIGPNYVYIALPRTASQSISAWLVEHHQGVKRDDLYHFATVPEEHSGKPVFTVVRNPYTRMASLYRMMVEKFWNQSAPEGAAYAEIKGCSFAEFIRWCSQRTNPQAPQWWSQRRILRSLEQVDKRCWPRMTHESYAGCTTDPSRSIGRYENLPDSLLAIARRGFVQVSLARLGKTEGPWHLLTPEEIAAVNEHSAEDFEQFGYERRAA